MSPICGLDQLLSYPGRATRALVDLDVIRGNVRRMKECAGQTVELMAVVKADGYGHGGVMVGREALTGGATWLGVATVAEGRELRDAGIEAPILVLGPIHATEIDAATVARLDVTVGDDDLAAAVMERARRADPLPRLHLKADTGMHRYGLSARTLLATLRALNAVSPPMVFALSTHLSTAEVPDGVETVGQMSDLAYLTLAAREIQPDLRVHIANSSATMAGLGMGTSMVRVGIAIYGCGASLANFPGLCVEPAMSVVSRLMRVHSLRAGDGVSYGRTYVADTAERVGLVPIGYADGYPRSLSNRGWMGVDGSDGPIRGRVCMDQTVIGDLADSVEAGTWVGVIGPALGGPGWDELADAAETIGYELLTSVGRRVARYYHRSGSIVAVRDELGRYAEVVTDDNAPDAFASGALSSGSG